MKTTENNEIHDNEVLIRNTLITKNDGYPQYLSTFA